MTATPGRTRCVTCGKEKATLKCGGCLQDFCYNHSTEHCNELSKQLDEVETTRDIFRQILTEQITKPQKHALMQQIDKWECDSIMKIRQTADEAREMLLKHTTGHIAQIETKLNRLTDQLRQSREENDFFETDLDQWKKDLTLLTEQLINPSDITIRQGSTPLVTKMYIDVAFDKSVPLYFPNIDANPRWIQNGITVAGGNGNGGELNQLSRPYSIYVDDGQTVYIADCNNHRIVKWKSDAASGQVVAGGNGKGNGLDQLNTPTHVIIDKGNDCLIVSDRGNSRVVRWPCQNGTSGQIIISDICCYGLAMDSEGYLYVSDSEKHEVKRWQMGDAKGTVVAGGNGNGNRLDQLNYPTYIFVDREHSVYVSDLYNYRVMKWMKGAKEGIVVAGGQSYGSSLTQLSNPNGIIVDKLGTIYLTDSDNNRVMRWSKGAREGYIVVDGNEKKEQSNQLQYPMGLSFDREDNLYVSDSKNHRVQKFNIDSTSTLY